MSGTARAAAASPASTVGPDRSGRAALITAAAISVPQRATAKLSSGTPP